MMLNGGMGKRFQHFIQQNLASGLVISFRPLAKFASSSMSVSISPDVLFGFFVLSACGAFLFLVAVLISI